MAIETGHIVPTAFVLCWTRINAYVVRKLGFGNVSFLLVIGKDDKIQNIVYSVK